MALDFLGGFNQVASGIGNLLDAFGVGKPKMHYGPTPSEAKASSLFQALLDPNNSLVKQNTDINLQKGMQDFLMQLKQMQMLDARRSNRGMRGTFFNPERADETINYLTTRGMPAIAEKAREKATGDIRNTANDLIRFVPIEQERINTQDERSRTAYASHQARGGYGGIADQFGRGLQDLLRMLVPSQNTLPWQSAGNVNPSGGYY